MSTRKEFLVKKFLTFQSRQCSACTMKTGKRCKNYTCYASNALHNFVPEKIRKKVETELMKKVYLSNCNLNDSKDCCGLCSGHMRMALVVLFGTVQAKTIFNQLNNMSGNDWNAYNLALKELNATLTNVT